MLTDMRIDPSKMIAGQPALEIRRLLRRTRLAWLNIDTVCRELGVSTHEAQRVITGMENAGLIEKEKSVGLDGKDYLFWENTIRGNALAMATTARPVKRKTAEKALTQFLGRVSAINENDEVAYRVTRVVVFGSYLTQASEINDVDLLVDLKPRNTNRKEQEILERATRARAINNGRQFADIVDELYWPLYEVRLLLKNRSRTLSLHYEDHALVKQLDHRVVFEYVRCQPY